MMEMKQCYWNRFYDSYSEQVRICGGVPVHVALDVGSGDSSTWSLNFEKMQAAVTDRTKLLFFNNPANVPGKVYSLEELQQLAEFCVRNDLLVVADEVYDVLVFDEAKHIRLASLPGMEERTITIGSAGKMFSVTGFKIGWTIAPPDITDAICRIHRNVPFCVSSTLQEAVAIALEAAPSQGYFQDMIEQYGASRRKLIDMLESVNLRPIVPQGAYFVVADAAHVDRERFVDAKSTDALDWQFCSWLTEHGGVCSIPISPFYGDRHSAPGVFARFAFCKSDEQIEQAGERLAKLKL
eukprot:TRINITY_DN9798_c0_g1_i1.p1 TRINITY_DN9798_c0_g1~~TRINITY_DN9798_c0_g1_i1.p1  ORF type:complete len:296 (+),score=79.03 TRINITY_DN9798_c0_g1_i1:398-1285(+)